MASNYNPTIAWKNANTKPLLPTYSPTLSWAATNNALTPTTAQTYLNTARGSSSTPVYPTPTTAPIPQAPVNIRAGGGSVLGASTNTSVTQNARNIGTQSLGGIASFSSPATSPTTMSSSPGGSSGNQYTYDASTGLTPYLASQGWKYENGKYVAPPEQTADTNTDTEKKPMKDRILEYMGIYKDAMPQKSSKTDLYKKTYGVDPEQARLEADRTKNELLSITSNINSINADKNTKLTRLLDVGAKEGVTTAVYGGQQAQIEREATIKLLPLQAQLATAQGAYEVAKGHLDNYFKVLSDDQDAQYKYTTDMVQFAFEVADKENQRTLTKLSAQKTMNNSNANALRSDINSWAINASQSGQSSLTGSIMALGAQLPNILDPQFDSKMQQISQKLSSLTGQVQPKLTGAQNDQSAINSINSQLSKAVGEDGFTDPNLYARLRASSGISPTEFDNRFGYLVNPASYAKLGLSGTKETSMTGEQLKQKINSQIATQDFKDLSKSDKKDYILSQGGDPTDFGY